MDYPIRDYPIRPGEIAGTPGLSVPLLRDETAHHAVDAEERGRQCLTAWLEQTG